MKSRSLSEAACSRKEAEHFYLLGLETALRAGFGIYVSGPITTGRRFLTFMQRHAAAVGTPRYAELFDEEVLRPNIVAQQKLISAVSDRLRPREVVIDPTVLPVLPNWKQSDYHSLWAIVIQRWARRVVFANDWQYSSGCTWEFVIAQRCEIQVVDAEDRPIKTGKAIDLISAAVRDIQAANGNTVFLERTLQELSATQQPR